MSGKHQRAQVYWAHLDPAVGREQARTRPCALVSDSVINQRRGTVVVVPLTTTVQAAAFPLLVALPSMGEHTKARTEHIRAIDKSRLGRLAGTLSAQDMAELGAAIKKVLALV